MSTPIDLTALKERQKVAWASGDYAVIGTTLQIVGENLAETCDLRCDEEVLDVAAGNGNATLAAARRGVAPTAVVWVNPPRRRPSVPPGLCASGWRAGSRGCHFRAVRRSNLGPTRRTSREHA